MIEADWSRFPQDRMHVLWAVSGAQAKMSADVNEIVEMINDFDNEGCTITYKRDSKELKMSIIEANDNHKCNYFVTNFNESDMDIIIESLKNMKNQSR